MKTARRLSGRPLRVFALLLCVVPAVAICGCRRQAEPTEPNQPQVAAPPPGPVQQLADEGGTIDLAPLSVFEMPQNVGVYYTQGLRVRCQDAPGNDVTYPKLNSEKPLFGVMQLPHAVRPVDRPVSYTLVVDEAPASQNGYDLLYVDLNLDSDLTNDEPLRPHPNPPTNPSERFRSAQQRTCFECFEVPIEFAPGLTQPVEVLPYIEVIRKGYASLSFIPTKARYARLRMAGETYAAYLGHTRYLAGPLNEPTTSFHLIPDGQPANPYAYNQLCAARVIAGKFYTFSATPIGDQLTVERYDGPLGALQIGTGRHNVATANMQGSLRSADMSIDFGQHAGTGMPDPVKQVELPVGDYYPMYMSITFDRMRVDLSYNYRPESGWQQNDPTYTLRIREDKPCLLEFSSDPEVTFIRPKANQTVRLGQQLRVEASLTDPALGILIRGLNDLSNVLETQEYTTPDGRKRTYTRYASFDPTVTITRADGKKIAEGKMPFG